MEGESIRVNVFACTRIALEISSVAIDTSRTLNADNVIDLPMESRAPSFERIASVQGTVQYDRLLVLKGSVVSRRQNCLPFTGRYRATSESLLRESFSVLS